MTIGKTLLRLAPVLLLAGCSGPPSPPPEPPRPVFGAWHDTVYADGLGAVVVVNGGPEAGKPQTDPLETWAWDGATWRAVAPAGADGPRWRNFAAVAYDSDRDVLIVHGGLQGRGRALDETWEWDGTGWSRRTARGPGGREGGKLVYDAARRLTVLYGGPDDAGTWGWDGTAWRRLAEAGPQTRFPGPVVYDPVRRRVVLHGGHRPDGPYALGDTWEFDGATWRAAPSGPGPGARVNAAGTFHAGLGRVVLVGGSDDVTMHADAWAWDGTAWTALPAAGLTPRQAFGLAYDPRRDRLVLTGGLDQPGTAERLQDVWEWDGTAFTRVSG